jgi:hypothetical protein
LGLGPFSSALSSNLFDKMKICPQCKISKLTSEFYRNRSTKDGLTVYCKPCIKEKSRTWGRKNPEKKKSQNQKNKNQIREATRRWYKEKGREYHANWRNENREKVREANRRYAALHIEERREMYRRRRKQIRGTISDITADWLRELQSITPNCELCDAELLYDGTQHDHRKANLDHIIPLNIGGTHTRENVRYICYLCNLRRPKNGSDHPTFITSSTE